MKIILSLFYGIVFLGFLHADDTKIVVANVESIEHGKIVKLEWSAPASKISSISRWNLDVGKFPLPVDEALKIAHTNLVKKFPGVKGWTLDSVNLKAVTNDESPAPGITGRYYYLVYLIPSSDDDTQQIEKSEAGELSFYVVILTDGTVLEPQSKIGNN